MDVCKLLVWRHARHAVSPYSVPMIPCTLRRTLCFFPSEQPRQPRSQYTPCLNARTHSRTLSWPLDVCSVAVRKPQSVMSPSPSSDWFCMQMRTEQVRNLRYADVVTVWSKFETCATLTSSRSRASLKPALRDQSFDVDVVSVCGFPWQLIVHHAVIVIDSGS